MKSIRPHALIGAGIGAGIAFILYLLVPHIYYLGMFTGGIIIITAFIMGAVIGVQMFMGGDDDDGPLFGCIVTTVLAIGIPTALYLRLVRPLLQFIDSTQIIFSVWYVLLFALVGLGIGSAIGNIRGFKKAKRTREGIWISIIIILGVIVMLVTGIGMINLTRQEHTTVPDTIPIFTVKEDQESDSNRSALNEVATPVNITPEITFEPTSKATASPTSEPKLDLLYVVDLNRLNVRECAKAIDEECSVIGVLRAGTGVETDGETQNVDGVTWWHVRNINPVSSSAPEWGWSGNSRL